MTDYLWTIFEYIVTVFESFVIMWFSFSALNFNIKENINKIKISISAVIYAILIIFLNNLMIYEGLLGILYSVFIFILISVFNNGNTIKQTILISIIPNLCAVGVNSIVSITMSQILTVNVNETLTEQNISRLIIILMVQILRLYILSIILKLIKKDEINLSTKEWAMISVLLLISVILFMCIHSVQLNRYTGSYNNIFLFLSKLGLIVINISAFNMIVALSKSNKTKNELIILKQIYDHQKEHADDVKRKNEEIRKIRHDITHIISVIQAFIEKNNIDGLSAYLNKLPLDSNSFDFNIDTKNDYVNGILNNKLSKAKSKGIKVLCSMPKHITGVDDIDLCVLLGNIIDNAIEACEKCLEGKYIEVSTRMNENNIFIEVYNTISMPFKDISFKTQKEDKDNHGYGIKSIKEIVSRYDGYLDYSNDAGLICCSVILNKN